MDQSNRSMVLSFIPLLRICSYAGAKADAPAACSSDEGAAGQRAGFDTRHTLHLISCPRAPQSRAPVPKQGGPCASIDAVFFRVFRGGPGMEFGRLREASVDWMSTYARSPLRSTSPAGNSSAVGANCSPRRGHVTPAVLLPCSAPAAGLHTILDGGVARPFNPSANQSTHTPPKTLQTVVVCTLPASTEMSTTPRAFGLPPRSRRRQPEQKQLAPSLSRLCFCLRASIPLKLVLLLN